MSSKVKVVAQYHNYSPPIDVYRSVQLLLKFVPQNYLVGLHKVVLTNSEEVANQIRGKISREKRRFRLSECLGFYSNGQIVLLIDKIFNNFPEFFLLIPPFKTYVIGETLYHEIGHHIHRIEQPGYRADKETVADEWKEKLLQRFVTERYWYLAKLIRMIILGVNPIASWLRRA